MDLTDEQLSQFVDNLVAELKRQDEELSSYICSEQFCEDTYAVVDFLQSHECIDNEHLLYFPEDGPMSEGDFCRYVRAVERICEKEDKSIFVEEEDNPFENREWERYGVIFRIMYGQGTCIQIWNKEAYEQRFTEEVTKCFEESGQ